MQILGLLEEASQADLKKREKEEKEWEESAERDYDEHQLQEVQLANYNSGLPPDLALRLSYNDALKTSKLQRATRSGNREIHRFWFLFRKRILERDLFQCLDCGSTEALVVHHLNLVCEVSQEEFTEENCVTLCTACHRLRHNKVKNSVKEGE